MIRSAPLLAALALGVRLAAQAPEEHAGHAEQLGRVRFATSCRGVAQRGVEHGVAYLHSFWYEKATEAFNAAAAADSSCAMAFWGQAMSLLHPLWTPPPPADAQVATLAIDGGRSRARTARERDYLEAIRAYYADYDRTDPTARLVRYATAMDGVRRHNPSDPEAAIFYALALIALGPAHPPRGPGGGFFPPPPLAPRGTANPPQHDVHVQEAPPLDPRPLVPAGAA